jgi:hypothetical protein
VVSGGPDMVAESEVEVVEDERVAEGLGIRN